ncbi:hypothetical protein CMEL01_11777 [Colletotrichum melonis]|uniref:Uncharacterized protein n=1 Tax=Colletotrichum melonis TaxID=1209925 RepID=A0AAI9UZ95_9PEZI|nr:hypothetical protein CMEL01_11777 [Colletotrichum melonis]
MGIAWVTSGVFCHVPFLYIVYNLIINKYGSFKVPFCLCITACEFGIVIKCVSNVYNYMQVWPSPEPRDNDFHELVFSHWLGHRLFGGARVSLQSQICISPQLRSCRKYSCLLVGSTRVFTGEYRATAR